MATSTQHIRSSTFSSNDGEERPHSRLIDVLTKYTPVQDSILRHLLIKDVISLTLVAKALSNMYKTVFQAQMNINHRLKKYFDDPIAFRNLQASYNIIVGGVFVLDYLSRGEIREMQSQDVAKECDFVLYVKQGRDFDSLFVFLDEHGYKEIEERAFSPRNVGGNNPTVKYRYFQPVETSHLSDDILVVITKTTPLYRVCMVMQTCLANFITSEKAYSLFPRTTFVDSESFILTNDRWGSPAARMTSLKFARTLGFTIQGMDLDAYQSNYAGGTKGIRNSGMESKVALEPRHVGDKHTWQVSLDLNGIVPSSTPSYITNFAEFQLKPYPSTWPFSSYEVRVRLVECEALRFAYSCLHDIDTVPKRLRIDAKRYRDLSLMGAMSLDDDDRPPDTLINNYFGNRENYTEIWPMFGGWDPPSPWRYYDDEVLDILKQKWSGLLN